MKCPHCLVAFHDKPVFTYLGGDEESFWGLVEMTCSACGRFIFFLKRGDNLSHEAGKSKIEGIAGKTTTMMVYPKGSSRPPVPAEVLGESPEIAEDYTQACLALCGQPEGICRTQPPMPPERAPSEGRGHPG